MGPLILPLASHSAGCLLGLINLSKNVLEVLGPQLFVLILSQIPKQMNTREKNNSKYQQEAKKQTERRLGLLNRNLLKVCLYNLSYKIKLYMTIALNI